MLMRDFGTPVVPPVSNTEIARSAYALGTQRRTGPPRSHSSSKGGNFERSSYDCTSRRGSQPAFAAQSSQNGQPVSGLKCQTISSRTLASSSPRAPAMADLSGSVAEDMTEQLNAGAAENEREPPFDTGHGGAQGRRRTKKIATTATKITKAARARPASPDEPGESSKKR